jgi:hypothetical protein
MLLDSQKGWLTSKVKYDAQYNEPNNSDHLNGTVKIEKRSTPEGRNLRKNEFCFSIRPCAKHVDGDSNYQGDRYPRSRGDIVIPETDKDSCSTELCR